MAFAMYDPEEWERLLKEQDDKHVLRIVLATFLIVAGTAAIVLVIAIFL